MVHYRILDIFVVMGGGWEGLIFGERITDNPNGPPINGKIKAFTPEPYTGPVRGVARIRITLRIGGSFLGPRVLGSSQFGSG